MLQIERRDDDFWFVYATIQNNTTEIHSTANFYVNSVCANIYCRLRCSRNKRFEK